MKRYFNYIIGALASLFICLALTSKQESFFQEDTATALTEWLNEKAIAEKKPLDYFLVTSVAFDQEQAKVVGGQQQKSLSFSYVCTVINKIPGAKVGDTFSGKGNVKFVTNSQGRWVLHHFYMKPS